MDLRERLTALARLPVAPAGVVSVYLDTRWHDEHQRERVRVFVKNEIARAREAGPDATLRADLDWVEETVEDCVSQARWPEAAGVALFACRPRGLREALPLPIATDEVFAVGDRPLLAPLAAVVAGVPEALVVFVDGTTARLMPLGPEGQGEVTELSREVEGRHSRGGWAQLAQSRYQRHIEAHRDEHFEAVAAALAQIAGERGAGRIVLAGETRTLAVFGRHLPAALARQVVGTIPASRHERPGFLAGRAADLLLAHERTARATVVAEVLTEAAKGGRAAAGVEATLAAVGQGAVHRLYLRPRLAGPARACTACGALAADESVTCPGCGAPTNPVDLGEALVGRVLVAGGEVEVVEGSEELERAGGVAARLRYPR